MKLSASLLNLILFTPLMVGCSTNTVFDDDAYRSVGGSASTSAPVIAALEDHGYQVEDGKLVNAASNSTHPHQAETGHVIRYGHPGIIDKIVKTARIHCQPFRSKLKTSKNNYWGEQDGYIEQCAYQLPKHCGGHTFAIIEYADKVALAFIEKGSSNYVIDLLAGTPAAKAGLWDKDDRIGSTTNNMGYMLNNNYNTNYQVQTQTPLHLGWIIQASYDDEATHGKLYNQAVTDILSCF